MLWRAAPGCQAKVAPRCGFARAGSFALLVVEILLINTTVQVAIAATEAALENGGQDARSLKDACAAALGGALLQEGCQAYQSSRDKLALWSSLIQVTRICKLDEPGPAPEDPEAALAASGNATDSYGLFWQVETAAPFQAFVATLNNATGLHNRYRGRTMAEYIAAWVEVWPNASFVGPNDWWMIGGDVYGEDVNHGVFLETGRLLQQDLDYQVSDIPVAFRNAGTSAYAGRFSALPLWLTTYQLLYRRDIFEARNITPPRTWDEAIAVAEQYGNGKLGPGQPELGFCFESKPACGYAHAAVIYILASMVQLTGPSHGAWFDPDTLEPLYQGVAFREALRIYRTLRRHSVPDATPCWEVYRSIASGRCLMMWGFAYGFKAASHNSSAMSGRQGVAPSPGSTLALDRRTGRLQPCTKELCPFAAPHVEPGTGRSVLVNVVTPIDTLNLAINALSPVNRQAAAYIMLRNFTRPAEHTRVMLMPKTEVVPMRYSQLDEKLWTDAGYNPTDVGDFLQTYRNYFASQNVYYELRIPGVFPIYWLLHNTMIKALYTNATDDELIAFAVGGTEPIFDANGGRARLTRLYQLSLGYVPPKQASAAEQHATTTLLVAVLVPVLSCLVLLAAGLWGYLHWRRLAHEKRDRLLAAPGPGPGTTLLVTDIQDSTCLWESLPAEAMDTAVKLHHRVIRELLLPHHGYETATEGDSFLLAFHKPNGALGFALAAQAALLSADWPAELLSSPYAATCCVRHDALVWATIAPCISAPLLHDAIAAAAMEAGGASQVCMSVAGGAMGMPRRASDAGRSSLAQGQLLSSNGMASPSPVQGHGGLLSRAPAAIQEGFVLDAPLYDDDGGGGVDASDSSAHSRRQQEPQQQQPQQQQTDTAISAACEAGFFSGVSAFTTASGCAALPPAVAARADAGLWTSGGVDDSGGSNTGTPGYASGANASANTSANGCATPVAAPSCGMPVVTRCTQVRAQPSDKPPRPYAVVSSRGTSRGGSRLSVLPPGRALGAPQQQQLLQQPNSRPPSGTMAFLARTDAGSEAGGDSTGHSRRSLPLLLAGLGAEAAAGGAAAASAAGGSNRPDSTVSQRSHHGGRGGAAVGMTLKEALQLSFPEVAAAGGPLMQPGLFHQPATAVIFRGLRVRMGLHCGLSGPAEVQYNRASGRITYPGRTMAMAKAVSDVGRGGNILLSSRVARALDQKATHSGAYVLLAAGRHVLKDGEEPVQLVAAFPRSLLPRAGHLLAPRSVEEKVPGVLSAPLGRAAVGVAQVQDAEDFAGWGLESSLESHRALLRQAGWLAGKHGGYLVTTAPGSFQAVFTLPAAAITWLLALQDEVAPALHDAVDLAAANAARCRSDDDDTAYNSPSRTSYAGSGSGSRDDELVLQRATMRARLSILHLRGGVDVGPVQACLAEAGEASYSGGAVKRAACLAAHAAWHEVLVSLEAAREVIGIRGELSSAAIPRSGASPAPAAAAGSPAAPFWLSSRKRMTHISEAAGDSMLVQSPQASSLQLSTPGMQSGISGMSSTTQQLPSATVSGPAAAEEIEAASGWDGAAALTPSASGDVGAFFRRAGVRATPGAGSGTVTPDRGTPRVTVRAPSHLGMRAREGGAAAMMLNPASHRPASAVVMPVARLPASAMGQLLGLPPAAGPAPLPVDAASVRPLQHEGQEEQQRPLDIGLGQEQQGDDETKEPPAEFAEPYVQQEGGGAVMDAADTNRDGSFTHVPPAIPAPASLPIHRIHHSQVETLRVPAASVSGAAGAPAQRPSVRELLRNRAVNFLRQQAARVSGGGLVAARLAPPVGAASASGADRSHTDLQMRPSLLGMAASASGAYDTAASPSSRVAERAPRALFAKSVVEVAVHTVSSGPALAKSGKAEGDAAGGAAEPAVEVLVFSREVLAVKHRGSALEACVVRLGGVRTAGPGVGAGAGARPKPVSAAAAALPVPV